MIESLVAQGFNAFLVFPGDANGTNATLEEPRPRHPVGGARRLHGRPHSGELLPRHGRGTLGLSRHEGAGSSAWAGRARLPTSPGFSSIPTRSSGSRRSSRRVAEAGGGRDHPGDRRHRRGRSRRTEEDRTPSAARGAEVDGIVTTARVLAVVAATSLRNLGDKRIKMVGTDHDEVVLGAIEDGLPTAPCCRTLMARAISASMPWT
ncbi:MAG: hypothetical protein R3C69_11160 [Geminicoccaceae bacterium]